MHPDLHRAARLHRLDAVADGVLHEGLEGEAGDQRALGRGVHADIPGQAPAEAEGLEVQVFAEHGLLLAHLYQRIGGAEGIAEQFAQGEGQPFGLPRPLEEGRPRDGIERVEEEMGADLILQAHELGLAEGLLRLHELALFLAELPFQLRLTAQVLHHRAETPAHRVEGSGERLHLVSGRGGYVAHLEVPRGDALRRGGEAPDRRRDRQREGDRQRAEAEGDEGEGAQRREPDGRDLAGDRAVPLLPEGQGLGEEGGEVPVDVGLDAAGRGEVQVPVLVAFGALARGRRDEAAVGLHAASRRAEVEVDFQGFVLGLLYFGEREPETQQVLLQLILVRGPPRAEFLVDPLVLAHERHPQAMDAVIAREARLELVGSAVRGQLDHQIERDHRQHSGGVEGQQLGPDAEPVPSAHPPSGPAEEGPEMARQEVIPHVPLHALPARFQGVQVAAAHLGGHFVANVEQLAEIRVEAGLGLLVPEGRRVVGRGPPLHRLRRRQPRPVDVHDGRVRPDQFVEAAVRDAVDFFRDREPGSARLGQADEFLQPARAGSLKVEAHAGFPRDPRHARIEGELVGPRMHRELEAGRKPEMARGVGGDAHIRLEFRAEGVHVAHVIHAFVEAAREFRRDRVDGHALVGEGLEDEEELCRRLRRFGLVHRHFHDEVARALPFQDLAVDRAGLNARGAVALGGGAVQGAAQHERRRKALHALVADERAVPRNEVFGLRDVGLLADEVRDVDGEEVAVRQERFHRPGGDMVRVHEIGALPTGGRDRAVRGSPLVLGSRADDRMLASALVPHQVQLRPRFFPYRFGRGDLRAALAAEAIAHAY